MRRRDERFATQDRHKDTPPVLHDKSRTATTAPVYQPHDFTYDATARTCVCPAGKSLYRKGGAIVTNGYVGAQFQGTLRDCLPCTHRTQCLRTPATTKVRHVTFFRGRVAPKAETYTARMKQRIDTPEGRVPFSLVTDVQYSTGSYTSEWLLNSSGIMCREFGQAPRWARSPLPQRCLFPVNSAHLRVGDPGPNRRQG